MTSSEINTWRKFIDANGGNGAVSAVRRYLQERLEIPVCHVYEVTFTAEDWSAKYYRTDKPDIAQVHTEPWELARG